MSTKTEYLDKMFKDVKRSHYKLTKESQELRDYIELNYRASGEFIRRITDMIQVERSRALQDIMRAMTEDMSRQRTEQVELASQMQLNIIDDMQRFENLLNEHKENTKRRHQEHQRMVQNQERATQLKIKEGGLVAREAENRVLQEREALDKTEQMLNNGLANFEYLRVQYVKDKFERMIRAQIQFHAKTIESLSQTLTRINNVNPTMEAHTLWRDLEEYDAKTGLNVQNHRPPVFGADAVSAAGLLIGKAEARQYIVPPSQNPVPVPQPQQPLQQQQFLQQQQLQQQQFLQQQQMQQQGMQQQQFTTSPSGFQQPQQMPGNAYHTVSAPGAPGTAVGVSTVPTAGTPMMTRPPTLNPAVTPFYTSLNNQQQPFAQGQQGQLPYAQGQPQQSQQVYAQGQQLPTQGAPVGFQQQPNMMVTR